MSSIPALRAALLASSALVAEVGQRIRVDAGEQKDAMPFIVFRRPKVEREMGLDGTVLAKGERFEIECWSEQRLESADLEDLVIQALLDAGFPPDDNAPDAIDTEVDARCTVVSVTWWTSSF